MNNQQVVRGIFIALCCAAAGVVLAQSAAPQLPPAGAPPGMPNTPAAAGMPGAPGAAAPANTYLLSSQVDWVPLTAPPPAAQSPEQARDLQAVLDAQAAARKGSRFDQAIGDVEISCSRIMDVLGIALDDKKLPKTTTFLGAAAGSGIGATSSVKAYWKRPRPIAISDKVEPRGDMAPGYQEKRLKEMQEKQQKEAAAAPAGALPQRPGAGATLAKPMTPEEIKKRAAEQEQENRYSSYPSGHAAFGTTCAIILGQMVPEKQAELFARADEYRRSRLIVGAHFPSDIEAGRILATAAAALMSQNVTFQRDLAAARQELRAALHLPAELPPAPHAKEEMKKKAD